MSNELRPVFSRYVQHLSHRSLQIKLSFEAFSAHQIIEYIASICGNDMKTIYDNLFRRRDCSDSF